MKTILLSILFIITSLYNLQAQNTDLPSPTANNQTLPSGSYVIAMDNTNQLNSAGLFNYKSYGLIVTLLNSSKKVKWVIKAGKAKDGIDFTVNASALIPVVSGSANKNITTTSGHTTATVSSASSLVVGMYITSSTAGIQPYTTITAISGTTITMSLPATASISSKAATFTLYTYPVSSYNFKAGPFVIFASDTTGVGSIINIFNSSIASANDYIKVYKTTASVTVDIRYDMSGFIPKAAILDDGANVNIHTTFMTTCNIPSTNYHTAVGQDLLTDCYTFASEAHNGNTGTSVDNAITAIKSFVQYGGNFLAECYAVLNYENNTNGHFQTTTGISDANSNAGTAISYPNPDLSYSQFEGDFSISLGGSLQNWRVNTAGTNNFHKHSQATGDATVMGSSVSKLKTGAGGLVFYLGNHTFTTNDISNINGIRMYMNAFLTPVGIANTCSIGTDYMYPLALKFISFQGNETNSTARLSWEVSGNETIKQFELERSTNGTNFTSAATINGNNIAGNESYFHSEKMIADMVYYRIKMTDKNGVVNYSKTIILKSNSENYNGLKIINNPVPEDRLSLEYTSIRSGQTNLRVMDMLGRVRVKQVINSNEGSNLVNVLLPSALEPGVYVAEINAGTEHFTAKFIRQ
jgi:hypothetical protein